MRKQFLIFAISILLINTARAQKSNTGNWLAYYGNNAINKKLNWYNEVQYRSYNFGDDFQQLLLRTGIGYNLTPENNNLLLGYGFVRSRSYIGTSDSTRATNEHRIYQQFLTRQMIGNVSIQHRYRVEERFIEGDFQLRFRYFLAANIPISKKKLEKNTVYLSLYDEIFINGQDALYDRNRLYGGLGYMISKSLKFELGFMAQTLQTGNRNQFQVLFFNNLPLRK